MSNIGSTTPKDSILKQRKNNDVQTFEDRYARGSYRSWPLMVVTCGVWTKLWCRYFNSASMQLLFSCLPTMFRDGIKFELNLRIWPSGCVSTTLLLVITQCELYCNWLGKCREEVKLYIYFGFYDTDGYLYGSRIALQKPAHCKYTSSGTQVTDATRGYFGSVLLPAELPTRRPYNFVVWMVFPLKTYLREYISRVNESFWQDVTTDHRERPETTWKPDMLRLIGLPLAKVLLVVVRASIAIVH